MKIPLSEQDLAWLAESFITPELSEQAQLFRVESSDGAELVGRNGRADYSGIAFPYYWPGESNPREYRLRRDHPELEQKPDGSFREKAKYLSPPGRGNLFYIPPGTPYEYLCDLSVQAVITEGEKKALALYAYFMERDERALVIALPGVWNWRGTIGKTEDEKGRRRDVKGVISDFGRVAWPGRVVTIIYDANVATNESVAAARRGLAKELSRRGARVRLVDLPQIEGVNGVDDLLALKGPEFLSSLFAASCEITEPVAPTVEILDEAPATLRRPLALLNGHAYAATWPYVRTTHTEQAIKAGEVSKRARPLVREEQCLVIVRDDGQLYGLDEGQSLESIPFIVRLPEIPSQEKLWSAVALKRYVGGERPDPADVFRRMVSVVDRFIDFDRSLAPQREMCEFAACYALATWMMDAFNVAGNIWPNGEKGSGKTQLLHIIAEQSYLGHVTLAGSSFAALRDMADYGAFLAFDDAENLADPRSTDPDKRALLLAGNRRGNTVALKDYDGKRWHTRHVSTFCPRAFSAIRLPDPVLASRTVVLPLLRTDDREKANADPLDDALWPHDRRRLVDDLWALALANLAAMPDYERRVGREASLTGRALECWRASLSVALWLDECGVHGLWRRMDGLSVQYQQERQSMESGDLTAIVIRALCRCFKEAMADASDVSDVSDVFPDGEVCFLPTAEITESAWRLAGESEADVDIEKITARRIGWKLKSLRVGNGKPERNSARTKRGWRVTGKELNSLIRRYGLNSSHATTSETSETSEENSNDMPLPDEIYIPPDCTDAESIRACIEAQRVRRNCL